MHINIDKYQFMDEFRKMDRMDNFSYDGLEALFEFFEEMEDADGQSIELDVIAICCDFTEDTYQDIIDSYDTGIDIAGGMKNGSDWEDVKDNVLEFLQDNTIVIHHDDEKVLFQAF